METTENNKLIAEFMGAKEVRKDNFKFPNRTGLPLQIGTIKYHSDWNWLMAVVDKIKSMGYYIDILIGAWTIVQIGKGNDKLFRFEKNKTIEAVYAACVEFIEWYNQQNQ